MTIPAPAVDEPAGGGLETAIVAGGCFWGVQAVFQHVNGVESAVSGYSGGTRREPELRGGQHRARPATPSRSRSRSTRSKVSYGKLLQIFFSVAHNPTELNYQGPDHGTQYRSAIFFTRATSRRRSPRPISPSSTRPRLFGEPIVTEVTPFSAFYPAEDYHQDYATCIPNQPATSPGTTCRRSTT